MTESELMVILSDSDIFGQDFSSLLIFHSLLMARDIIMILANANCSNCRPTLKFNGRILKFGGEKNKVNAFPRLNCGQKHYAAILSINALEIN